MSNPPSAQMPFAHLHCHSHYSLLDGANRIPELVATITDAWLRRQLIDIGETLANRAFNQDDATTAGILAAARERLAELYGLAVRAGGVR